MQKFEREYVELVDKVLNEGFTVQGRNGLTLSTYGNQIKFKVDKNNFPLLQGRKIYFKGIAGELAAFFANCDNIEQFKAYGCNYWDSWAAADGHIEVDYAKQLHDFNGVNQLDQLIDGLINNPTSRRHIISLWRPDRLDKLSLPCCHYAYQFHVDSFYNLHMTWVQRSVDVMVGLPSDMVLASLWVLLLAQRCGLKPGVVTMQLGDTHIYSEHKKLAEDYIRQALDIKVKGLSPTKLKFLSNPMLGLDNSFNPSDIQILTYHCMPAIKFILKV